MFMLVLVSFFRCSLCTCFRISYPCIVKTTLLISSRQTGACSGRTLYSVFVIARPRVCCVKEVAVVRSLYKTVALRQF